MGSSILIRINIFIAGFSILAIGFIGASQLGKEAGPPFLLGALTLGGGLVICGAFTLKMLWHGIIGAGALSLIGFSKGVLNLPDMATYFAGDRSRSIAPMLEFAVTLVCIFLLLRIVRTLSRERTRRMLEER
ncbi:MAG: hypothetical protein AB8D78_11165 [Akkermansiaceae bacterium]